MVDGSLPDDYSVMCPKDIVLEYDENTVFLEDGTKWTLKCNITDNDSAGNATFVNIAVYKGNSTDLKLDFYAPKIFQRSTVKKVIVLHSS